MVYSTQDLIEILDQELNATLRGDRLLLSPDERIGVPIVTMALDSDQLGKVFACQDFAQQIHQYQQENQVSGLIWREITVGDHKLRLPERHPKLIAIEEDKAILQAAKAAVLEFWQRISDGLKFWQVVGQDLVSLTQAAMQRASHLAEWAELEIGHEEYYLALCWGDPNECHYRWANPKSGCDRLIAAAQRPQLTNIF